MFHLFIIIIIIIVILFKVRMKMSHCCNSRDEKSGYEGDDHNEDFGTESNMKANKKTHHQSNDEEDEQEWNNGAGMEPDMKNFHSNTHGHQSNSQWSKHMAEGYGLHNGKHMDEQEMKEDKKKAA